MSEPTTSASLLTHEERRREQALMVARDVLKATSLFSSGAVDAGPLITVAEWILAAPTVSVDIVGGLDSADAIARRMRSTLRTSGFAELVDDGADGTLKVRDGSVEQLAGTDEVPVFFGDVVDDLPSQDSECVELGAGDVQRVGEILDGHEELLRSGDGQALTSPEISVDSTVAKAADTSPSLGVGVEGAAVPPGPAAPVSEGGEAS